MCKDIHAPGFYVHITSDECFFAVGCWHPDADALSSIRNLIVVKPEQWLAARDDKKFKTHCDMRGLSLPHAARGYYFNNPLFKGIKRKYFISPSALSITEVSG